MNKFFGKKIYASNRSIYTQKHTDWFYLLCTNTQTPTLIQHTYTYAITQSASPTTELSTSIDNSFGLLTMPSTMAMPSSRLSLNGNALALSAMRTNLQMMPRNSLHSSKSNDAIHSHDLATITSNRRALQHFNIDEYYVPNDERTTVMGKIIRNLTLDQHSTKNKTKRTNQPTNQLSN